jgi:hypothetical protein
LKCDVLIARTAQKWDVKSRGNSRASRALRVIQIEGLPESIRMTAEEKPAVLTIGEKFLQLGARAFGGASAALTVLHRGVADECEWALVDSKSAKR